MKNTLRSYVVADAPRVYQRRLRRPQHRALSVAMLSAFLVLVSAVSLPTPEASAAGVATASTVTASSTLRVSSPRNAVTGTIARPGLSWRSDVGNTTGAWLNLAFSRPEVVAQVQILRNSIRQPGVTAGFLSFSDGSTIPVALSTTSELTAVPVPPRRVGGVRFTATAVQSRARYVEIAEIGIVTGALPAPTPPPTTTRPPTTTKPPVTTAPPATTTPPVTTPPTTTPAPTPPAAPADGNVASTAVLTQRSGATVSDPRTLVDGSGVGGPSGVGAEWTAAAPVGTSIDMTWPTPQTLTSISLTGAPQSGSRLRSATLTTDGGSPITVGAVLPENGRATVLAFAPRTVRSLRLTLDTVTGSGPLTLSELRVYQRGFTPVRAADPGTAAALPTDVTCGPVGSPPASGLVVRCPGSNAAVDGRVTLRTTTASGYTGVTATVWPSDTSLPAGPTVRDAPDARGDGILPVDLSIAPRGPVTVKVEATGSGKPTRTAYFQLYRADGPSEGDVPSSAAVGNRTLVYSEEFNRPVSMSRTGAGADYAAAKPTDRGAEDFGDAVFPDPAKNLGNVGVVDDRYLKMGVEPLPAGFSDPGGYGRKHLGGMLASARQGGSGFSAQYGYFEARMYTPAVPGTWPAFWMLPSDNLIAPTPTVAEIDAMEQYGQFPAGSCQSTHDYRDGRDTAVNNCSESRFPSDRVGQGWHTWGVAISPTVNTFYVDGRVVATAPQVAGGGAPMFFLVDMALGGGWPLDLSAVQDRPALYVDYIRVYV